MRPAWPLCPTMPSSAADYDPGAAGERYDRFTMWQESRDGRMAQPCPVCCHSSEHAGRVLLLVNVASKCGLTPQYEGLQSLYRHYHARGLVILGFPANDFNGQEPDGDTEIATFCRSTYSVEFQCTRRSP